MIICVGLGRHSAKYEATIVLSKIYPEVEWRLDEYRYILHLLVILLVDTPTNHTCSSEEPVQVHAC